MHWARIAVSLSLSLLLFILAVLIATGRGDKLIAGYNTASAKEKAKVDIKRLRLLVGLFCAAVGTMIIVDLLAGLGALHITIIMFWLTVATAIFANPWTVKKR